jgi:ubiquinone/menaquinone biosynthesis C-methylase UbiE
MADQDSERWRMGVSFDRIADRYDSTRGYPDRVMEDILAALERVLDRERRILDAGVGTARFAKPLQDRGFEVIGLDISKRMLAKARAKSASDLFRGDMCSLPFRDDAFGTTLSIHVLHLVSKWRCALGEIGRVTTDNFVSVAFNKEESPAEELRRSYDQACAELGHAVRHPGLRERELPDLLEPDSSTVITLHEHPIDVQGMIGDFETRTYSSQWMVPEEIHEQAIEALRQKYDGVQEIMGREKISLLVWDIDKVWEFASGPDPGMR